MVKQVVQVTVGYHKFGYVLDQKVPPHLSSSFFGCSLRTNLQATNPGDMIHLRRAGCRNTPPPSVVTALGRCRLGSPRDKCSNLGRSFEVEGPQTHPPPEISGFDKALIQGNQWFF